MSKSYFFETDCTQCDHRVDALNAMIEEGMEREITYGTMLRHCQGLLTWAKAHGYDLRKDQGLTLRLDCHVTFHKSHFEGRPCYYLQWSGIEFIWCKGSETPGDIYRSYGVKGQMPLLKDFGTVTGRWSPGPNVSNRPRSLP